MKANSHSLYYEIHGEGKPLVLVAGFTCNAYFWAPYLRKLSRHFKVLVFDNLGIGRSDCPDISYSIEMMAECVTDLIQQLGLEKPHLLGHSMGGTIAQEIARKHGKLIDKLILSNTFIQLNPVSIAVEEFVLHLLEAKFDRRYAVEAVLPWLCSEEFLANKARVEQFIRVQLEDPYPISIVGFKRQLEAMTSFNSSPWISHIESKTLVINSAQDLLCPNDSNKLAKEIKSSSMYTFENMGHLPMIEKPQEYLSLLLEFLHAND